MAPHFASDYLAPARVTARVSDRAAAHKISPRQPPKDLSTAVLIRDTPLPPRPQTPAAPVVDETADPDGADESDETGESADPAGD